MPYAKSLRTVLREKDPTLHSRLNDVEKLAESVLTYTAGAFPHWTPHGFTHSLNVEENLNWLIPDEEKHNMNAMEIFFLILAAWLHDWGMVCKPGERPGEVRDIHHLRTEQNFENMYHQLKLDQHEARIIGRIARGHRVEDLRSDLFDRQIYSADIHIDVRFLAAILRLADECDITHSRVPEIIYYSLNPQGASEEHFRTHLSIGGIGKWVEHKIEFNAVARDPKGSQTLYALRDKIQKEIDNVKGILAEHKIPIEYVEAHVDSRGFIDKPISFRLDQNKVTQLLIGEALYSRKDVAIRELLQNAVDTCRLRKNLQPAAEVAIRIYREANHLVVKDNGIGMDYEAALNFLANKGFSYYGSEEFKKIQQQIDFDPVSRWGLGILSGFLIASELVIETKKEGKDPCSFIIRDIGEGWRYEEGSMKEPGTIITLTLNEEGLKIDLEKVVRHYVKSSTVPIFLGKDTTQPLKFDWTLEDDDVQSYLSRYYMKPEEAYEAKLIKEYEDDEIFFRYYQTKYYYDYSFLANQGFFVELLSTAYLPQPHNSVFLVNTKREILDLNIARENVRKDTTKFLAFQDRWFRILIRFLEEDYQEELKNLGKSLVERAVTYQILLNNYNLGDLFPFRGISLDSFPNSYRDFLLRRMPNLVLTNKGLKVLFLKDIISIKPKKSRLIT